MEPLVKPDAEPNDEASALTIGKARVETIEPAVDIPVLTT